MNFSNLKWKRYFLILTVLFLTVLLFEILPKSIFIIENSFLWISNESNTQNILKTEAELNNVMATNKYLKNVSSSLVANFREEQKLTDIYSLLNQAAAFAGIPIVEIKTGILSKNNSDIWSTTIDIKTECSYEQTFNFLRFVENSPKAIQLNSLHISKKADQKVSSVLIYYKVLLKI